MGKDVLTTFILLCFLTETVGVTTCPHQVPGLSRWSLSSSLPNGNTPNATLDVYVDTEILLDTSPPEFRGLTIGPNGRLVWSPDVEIHLQCRYIRIQGKLEIGSEDCKFETKTKITLKGERNEYPNIPGFGQKFIGVEAGGTFEVHGGEKYPWTKLTTTLPKVSPIYDHIEAGFRWVDSWYRGVKVYTLDKVSHQIISKKTFTLSGGDSSAISTGINTLKTDLEKMKAGTIVLMAVQRTLNPEDSTHDFSELYAAFENFAYGSVTNSSAFRTLSDKDAYAMIAYAGEPSKTIEMTQPYDASKTFQHVKLVHPDFDVKLKMTVESYVHNTVDEGWRSYVNFQWLSTDDAYPILDTIDIVETWNVGDTLFIASTDYDMNQLEYANVIECQHCRATQVRVDREFKHTHFGEIVDNLDMRAEVGVLSRNILIEGEVKDYCPDVNENCVEYPYDTFGGHIKFLRNFANVHVEGAELNNMGQQTSLGNYPLHFHMCENVGDYQDPPYLKNNSIHNTFARGITIHGTHNVTVMDNTCVDTLGHTFFLEDGGEKNTVFDGNFGALTKKATLIPSDQKPTTFWITNPLTTMRNNVAAGSEDTGVWFIFPVNPLADSANKGFMEPFEARETPILLLENMVTHSNKNGIKFENQIMEDGSIDGINYYTPKVDPLNNTKPYNKWYQPAIIKYLTAHKNNYRNGWFRGEILIRNSSFGESSTSITFASSNSTEQFLEYSVILGDTPNIGEPTRKWNDTLNTYLYYPRALPVSENTPIQGFEFYDGPVHISNVWFNYFKSNENRTAGAIAFLRNNKFSSSPVNSVKNVLFGFNDPEGGNQVFSGDETVPGFGNLDGDKAALFQNKDSGKKIVKPFDFHLTNRCQIRSNWKMAECDKLFGKLQVKGATTLTTPTMARDDTPTATMSITAEFSSDFLVILGGSFSYTLHWSNGIPSMFYIYGKGIEKNLPVRVGMCMPLNAQFDLYSYEPIWSPNLSRWTRVNTMIELDNDVIGNRYFYDDEIDMLFVKLLSYETRTENDTSTCLDSCPMVRVNITGGDRSRGDCQSVAYPKYQRTSELTHPVSESTETRYGTPTPPANFGAGSTKPFRSRGPRNGGYSPWSVWSQCSVTCGGGTQSRSRECNSPEPANGGLPCDGPSSETLACSTDACPPKENGSFGTWSDWSICIIEDTTVCQGYKIRTRSCNNPTPSYGGTYCSGAVMEEMACNICPTK